MSPEHWQQVKALLDSALEREPDARAAFLDEACGNDQVLRREVESFIAAHEKAGSFIEQPVLEMAAPLMADNPSESVTGQMIGHYRVLRQLCAGGMGVVYLARDTRLGRQVALKLLPPYFTSDKDRVRRFQQEARAASALNHPNILTIYETGKAGNREFIATEFIEGESLRQPMSRARMNPRDVVEMAIQIAGALAAAHEAGIIHRDIKPENIMVRPDGYIKVLDFGLAKLTETLFEQQPDDSQLPVLELVQTESGMLMGTVKYMSPEQADGLRVDARTDIWSLGCVLYEMIAGHPPFEGSSTGQVIVSILEREPAPLAEHNAPAELQRIVKKALRKDREARYQTIKEMLVDLKSLKQELEFEAQLKNTRPAEVPVQTSTASAAQARTITAETVARQDRTSHKKALLLAASLLLAATLGLIFIRYKWAGGSLTTPTPTVSAEATPADSASPKPFDPAVLKKEVSETLEGWVASMMSHDLDAHMSYYADQLDTYEEQDNVSASRVRADTLRIFEQYATINLKLSNLDIAFEPSGQSAIAIFDKEQDFYGNGYSLGGARQELWLTRRNGRWQITGEKTLQVYYTDNGDGKKDNGGSETNNSNGNSGVGSAPASRPGKPQVSKPALTGKLGRSTRSVQPDLRNGNNTANRRSGNSGANRNSITNANNRNTNSRTTRSTFSEPPQSPATRPREVQKPRMKGKKGNDEPR